MFDCSKDVLGYHDDKVTLPQAERNEMAQRRDANRERLKKGLEKNKKPQPKEFKSQGSYGMKTMTQHPKKDYDIDDGVYFDKSELVGPRGADMTSSDAKQMVRDALDDGSFNKPPETRKNCVRIFYAAGYHVDVPVYRVSIEKDVFGKEITLYELASSDWKKSDARDVTKWFEMENASQSPDDSNGGQMRRVVRLIKAFAKSRESWNESILSGFGITKLVTEKYQSNPDREDVALHDTMKAIRDRLEYDLVVKHPVTTDDTITNGTADPKAKFLREKLTKALEWLEPVFDPNCTREEALDCWDKVYSTTYFSDRSSESSESKSTAATNSIRSPVFTSGLLKETSGRASILPPVRKEGGGRYA